MSSQGLPVSRLINVSINLSPPAAQAPNLNSCLIVGSSNVIDVGARILSFGSIEEVAALFGTAAPEYLAAALYFGQTPQPSQVFIGRWAEAATAGLLNGGSVTVANQAVGAWTGITTGAFFVYEDSIPRSINGLNFSAVTNMNGVAAIIQTAMAALEAGTTCVWDAVNERFVFASGSVGVASLMSFLQAPTATGKATFSVNPAANDTLTLNGTTVTFVAGAPAAFQVQIGVDLPTTLASLLAFLSASVDTQLVKFSYSVTGSVLYFKAVASGVGGNALTLAKVSTAITLSAGTLAGGSGVDVSHMLAGLSTDGGNTVAGIAAETPVAGIAILDNQSQYWYMVGFADTSLTNDQIEAVAGYIEAANNKHIYGVCSTDTNILNANSTSDIAYALKQLGYTRTMVQYSENYNAVFSAFGRAVTVNFSGNNTVISLMYKVEPGVVPENLSTAQADAIHGKNANVFVNYNNNTAILQYGQMSNGGYFDEIQDLDWMAYDMQTAIFNLLYTSATKIPQTDAGNHQIANAIESACAAAVNNGTLAPGYWNTNGFGQLKNGDYLDKGYYIYQPPLYLESQADRTARKSVPFQVAAKLAGAINTVDVIINVNR